MKNIVLVHGGFVDGAGWEGVYKILKRDGYSVSIVQNPHIVEDDRSSYQAEFLQRRTDLHLVAIPTGEAVITEAGKPSKVSALVYIAAFAPDKGESVDRLLRTRRPNAPVPQYCRARRAFCSSTRRSFPLLSQPTWTQKKAAFMA